MMAFDYLQSCTGDVGAAGQIDEVRLNLIDGMDKIVVDSTDDRSNNKFVLKLFAETLNRLTEGQAVTLHLEILEPRELGRVMTESEECPIDRFFVKIRMTFAGNQNPQADLPS